MDSFTSNDANRSKSSIISSVERLPERRKTLEDMSSQDWMHKVHRLKLYADKLENELEKLQFQYDHVFQQKEAIRLKAKELTETVSDIYHKFDELEIQVKEKDDEILRLNERIHSMEKYLNISSTDVAALNNSAKKNTLHLQPESSLHHPLSSASGPSLGQSKQEEFISELISSVKSYQQREELTSQEMRKLQSKVVELEEKLSRQHGSSTIRNSSSFSATTTSPRSPALLRKDISPFQPKSSVNKSLAFPLSDEMKIDT
jgi:hypothetical protein